MNSNPAKPARRVVAELPNGDIVVPGVAPACPGFDAVGACNAVDPHEAPCAGATWHYEDGSSWRFVFRADSGLCPAVLLDPLGLPPTADDELSPA
jgi:hypothetical protein